MSLFCRENDKQHHNTCFEEQILSVINADFVARILANMNNKYLYRSGPRPGFRLRCSFVSQFLAHGSLRLDLSQTTLHTLFLYLHYKTTQCFRFINLLPTCVSERWDGNEHKWMLHCTSIQNQIGQRIFTCDFCAANLKTFRQGRPSKKCVFISGCIIICVTLLFI